MVALKKLSEQVLVITGATSGVGLVTARRASRRGARLVLVARNAEALNTLVEELRGAGGEAVPVVADVADAGQLRLAADAAIRHFGGFDTWVNNAGVSIFGRTREVSLEDQRRLFDTNYWGVVHGSLIAAEHLRRRGGSIINVGSELSEHPAPLQASYSASKHAVKGFTDSLRLELEEEGAPVSVTLIKPAALNTPFIANAKNYMEVAPKLPPPLYAPDLAAAAILNAAEHARREIYVGGSSRLVATAAHMMPRALDKMLEHFMFDLQRDDAPAGPRDDHALYRPRTDGRERVPVQQRVMETSVYTSLAMHPMLRNLALLAAGLLVLNLTRSRRRD